MIDLGDRVAGQTIDFKFSTPKADGTLATLSGSPTVVAYKNNSTTEDTDGLTLTTDFDSRTGLNHVRIDLSADATFYAAGSDIQIVLTAGTVDSKSVAGYVIAQFSIRNRRSASPSEVNAEVLDVMTVDTFAQPGQEAPAATTTMAKMMAYLYKAWRNRTTQTSSEYSLYADDATTKDQKASVSDNGTTFDRGEIATGP